MEEKNLLISLFLGLIVTGLGLVYIGLVKRGIVSFIIAIFLGLLNMYVSSMLLVIALIFGLYILYDTYICTNAINNNEEIPKYLTLIELE